MLISVRLNWLYPKKNINSTFWKMRCFLSTQSRSSGKNHPFQVVSDGGCEQLRSLISCFKKRRFFFFLNPQHCAVLCNVDAKRCEELLFSPQDHQVKVYRMLTSQMLLWFPWATEPANEVWWLWGRECHPSLPSYSAGAPSRWVNCALVGFFCLTRCLVLGILLFA